MKKIKKHLINEEINFSEVRLVDHGIIKTKDAQLKAESMGLDLVLINQNSNPPICKIFNYEKFIYENSKRDKQKVLDIKEIKIGPNTSEHDLGYRINQMIGFLDKGHKVKITMQFKGREMSFVEKGELLILTMIKGVSEHGAPEDLPKMENKKMFVTIKPKNKK